MSASNSEVPQGHAAELLPHDLLSGDGVPMPVFDAGHLPEPVVAVAGGNGSLQIADLLDAGGAGMSGMSGEGGFLVFDHQSNPGTTIVRVMLEGADHHQLFEIGTLPGGGPDLNSLLGLLTPDAGLG